MSWGVMSWTGKSDVYQQPRADLCLPALCCSIGAAPRVAVPCSLLLHTPITRRADHASARRSPRPRSSRGRLLRHFRACPGRLLFGGRMAAAPGRHFLGRGLLRLPRLHEAAGRRRCGLLGGDAAWLSLLQVWCVETHSQDMCVSVPLGGSVFFFWFFQVGRLAAAAPGLLRLGCSAWGLPSKVTCGRVTKTHAANLIFL